MDLFDKCRQFTRAREAMETGIYPYFRAISSGQDTEVVIKGQKMIMIGSNNYLGLTSDTRVKEAAVAAVRKFGSGCTGSRFLNGTLELHEELEARLAEFMEKEAALVFSTGFQTNLGTLAPLLGRGELLFMDRANHASLVDGSRLTFGKTYKYGHNDAADLDRVARLRAGGLRGVIRALRADRQSRGRDSPARLARHRRRGGRVRRRCGNSSPPGLMSTLATPTAEHRCTCSA